MAQPTTVLSSDTVATNDNDAISSGDASTASESDTEYNELADLPEHLQLNLSATPELFEPLLVYSDLPEFDLNLLQRIYVKPITYLILITIRLIVFALGEQR